MIGYLRLNRTIRMTVIVLLVMLFLPPGILCQHKYQTIPLRFDLAIAKFGQYQHFIPADILNDVPYSITLTEISARMSSLSSNQTTICEQEFGVIVEAALRRDMWALKVIDAWGKPLPSGILKGNLYWTGNYDECLQQLYLPENKSFVQQPFDTQYCALFPTVSFRQDITTQGITLGLCVPSSCDRQSLASLVQIFFENMNITEDDFLCSNDPPNGQNGLSRGAIATCVVLSLLALLVLVGTIADLTDTSRLNSVVDVAISIDKKNHLSDTEVTQSMPKTLSHYSRFSLQTLLCATPSTVFIAEFSAIRTLRRIFTMKTKNDENSFPFINGIRVLALFWVILGHSFQIGIFYSQNILDVAVWTRNLAFQLILNGVLNVDTFFVLSGFLTAIVFVRQVNKEKRLSFHLMILYYIHRYVRLTPVFLLIILISINLTPYFGHAPLYPTPQGFENDGCRNQYWWTSVLYVGNLVEPDQMCLTIAWYLHNDMQFHWVAPLALIPFVIGRKSVAFIVTIFFVLTGIGSTLGILLYYPNMEPNFFDSVLVNPGPTFFKSIYITPWCRISAYAIGLLTGFVVINTGRTYRLNISTKLIGTILAILIALACMFAFYPNYIYVPGINRSSLVAYQSLCRTGWSLAIGWLLFLCCTNQAGIVNTILSWPIWSPLGRLNYSAYLVHATIIYITVFNQTAPTYYQPHVIINKFISNLFFTYVTAIVAHIFFETPFFVLEKKIFKR